MSFAQCKFRCARNDFSVDVDFIIPEKGVLGIFGDSGCGKTTVLRCLAGLEKNVQGSINVAGLSWLDASQNLAPQKRNIAYVFQEGRLFPHLTVLKNLHYGCRSKRRHYRSKIDGVENRIDFDYLIDLLNIAGLLNRYPFQLSGGEKQRVAIARALLSNPELILLDEPLASLDKKRRQEILPYLEILHEELSIPMIYVSHELDEMLRLCDYMLVMDQGKVKYKGDIHNVLVDKESPLASVDNAVVVLEASVSKQEKNFSISTVHTVNGNQFQLPGLMPIGKHVRLVVYARDVSVAKTKVSDSSILNIIEGQLSAVIEKKEGRVLLQINCRQDILLSLISVKSFQLLQLVVGAKVYIQVKAVVTRGG